jgi:hypothetical protein
MKPVQIRHITGGQLSDSNETLKARFREFLTEDWEVENYEFWIKDCLEKNLNKELQDIIVSLGAKLGFEVEYGRYAGKQGEIGVDGIWKRSGGETIALEVKAATWPGPDISQLANYMSQLAKERGWDLSKVYGLYIIGDQNSTSLVAQIKGSHPKDMRVIKYADLLRLYQLKLDLDSVSGPEAGTDRIQKILLPFENIDIGDFISLILEIAEFKHASEEEPDIEAEDTESELLLAWSSAELLEYLNESTPIQKALLAILARAPTGEWVWRKQIIAEMPALLTQLGADERYKAASGYTIAAAIAGMTMRRKPIRKESILTKQMHGQKLALSEQYASQVKQWLLSQKLA